MAGPNPLYGQTGAGENRFAVAGDLRRMYPVGAAGGLFSIEQLGQKLQSGSAFSYYVGDSNPLPVVLLTGVSGSQNMISNGSALFGIGNTSTVDGTIIAQRFGVTGTSGGNSVNLAGPKAYGTIVTTQIIGGTTSRTFMYGGEAIYQNGNATTSTIGASVEQFPTNVGGTVTIAGASTSLQGNGTTFTTASLTSGALYPGYIGNLPSKTLLQAGDLILITLDSGSKSLHRIVSVNAATGAGALTITPAAPSGATVKAYVLYRSGGPQSNSRVVSISDGTNNFYNYYVGSATGYGGGTIEAFLSPAGAGTRPHYMAPQTTSGCPSAPVNVADIKAVDIAYYKGFLLYMNRGTISWSAAGFPSSFTTGFGQCDFPAINITVVDNTDNFMGFEYLGDQLIAIGEHGLWEVSATGSVPEFEFFRLPEPVGAFMAQQQTKINRRPFCSGRNAVFYWANGGLMMLDGQYAKNVSLKVFSALQAVFSNDAPNLTWEPTTNTVILSDTIGEGFMYNVETDTWSYMKMSTFGVSAIGFTGDVGPHVPQLASGFYDYTGETITWHDDTSPGPWLPYTFKNVHAIWATPIIGTGDAYDGFQMAGFQLDGYFGGATATWTLYTGPNPYSLQVKATGTVEYIDDRRLLGPKVTDPFFAIVFTFSGSSQGLVLNGVNIYPEGRGK